MGIICNSNKKKSIIEQKIKRSIWTDKSDNVSNSSLWKYEIYSTDNVFCETYRFSIDEVSSA